ncbi:MAG: sensor histidine kinase [Saprospiraceae bacterium]
MRYRQSRHKEYFYYTLYLLIIWLYILRTQPGYFSFLMSDDVLAGLSNFLKKGSESFNSKSELIFSNAIQILYLLFIREIFNYRQTAPSLYRFATFLIRFQTVALLLQIFVLIVTWKCISSDLGTVFKLVFLAPCIYLLVKSYYQKIPTYRNIIWGSMALISGALIAAVLHMTDYSKNNIALFELGVLLEIFFFNTALGQKEKFLEDEKRAVENKLLELEKEKLESDFNVLKSQINPHFVSNCLNSIKQLVNENKREEAILYLVRFSDLMRYSTDYITRPDISLEEELAISSLYLQMESLRFGEAFSWQIEIEEGLDASFIKVPPFVLQPFLENAIWHGLLPKESNRVLKITLENSPQSVNCVIDDNGMGRERAGALPMHGLKKGKSSIGIINTQERLRIFRQLQKIQIDLHIIDKHDGQGNDTGTRVELVFPV